MGLPFPSNDQPFSASLTDAKPTPTPWERLKASEPPPLMFQVKFLDGRMVNYAYSDLRETRMLHAGYLTLCIYGMEKYHVVIEGRNLTDLVDLFNAARVKSLEELGPRTFDRPETGPAIDKITVETLTGPSF